MVSDPKKYIPIPISELQQCAHNIPFTVYIRLGESKFVAIFNPQLGLDPLRLFKYSQKIDQVYIEASERESFEAFTQASLEGRVEEIETDEEMISEENKKIIETLEKATEKNLDEIIMPKAVSVEEIDRTKTIVKAYVKVLARDADLVYRILSKFNESNYLHYHSLATSIFSIFICRLTKQFGERLQEVVGLGGLLHDIGKIQVMDKNELKGYTDNQLYAEALKPHPNYGLTMVQHNKSVLEEVKQIIYQHHERIDGNGYPLGVRGHKWYYPASLVAVASTFVNYVGKNPFGLEMTPRDAIRRMLDDEGHFNKQIIKPLTVLFKV